MQLGGYTNRVASGSISPPVRSNTSRFPRKMRGKYIGARGLGVRYVYDNGPTVDPLSPTTCSAL